MDRAELDKLLKRNSQQSVADIAIFNSNITKLLDKDYDVRHCLS